MKTSKKRIDKFPFFFSFVLPSEIEQDGTIEGPRPDPGEILYVRDLVPFKIPLFLCLLILVKKGTVNLSYFCGKPLHLNLVNRRFHV